MVKLRGLLALGLASCLCFFLLVSFNQQDYQRRMESYPEPLLDDFELMQTFNITSTKSSLKEIIRQQQDTLEEDLFDYQFPPNTNLKNFTMAAGGQPIRSIIITTWRSGSTFLGDVLNAVPGNFYHYEPLLDYGIVQIRGPPLAASAVTNLKRLLTCDYKEMSSYLDYGQSHVYLFTHNTRLWNQCEAFPKYCWNSTFLSELCRLFPFQSMKVVRLRLRIAKELLKDDMLNVRVLLLIRDPRGTLQSRRHRDWCPGEPDCDQPNLLCADMVSDYSAAMNLQNEYPTRFRAIRYEDLSLDPHKHVEALFDFFGLHFHPKVVNFLDSHTKLDAGGVSSTFRNSKSAPFHWRQDLNFSEVQFIEEHCDEAMKLWGYVKARNESHLREMNPLATYTIN